MRISNPSDRLSFQKKIFSWWRRNRRDLPWRHTRDPYKILVSEVMLQQTQVSRVLAGYAEFVQRYPTVQSLAAASPASVIRIWKGLGYNRRALYLHRAAKIIVERYHGCFPMNHELLTTLPGVGRYTAAAILVFAYRIEVPLVDTNIRRIITHFFFHDKPQKPSVVEDAARRLLPKGKSWEWHQALMDFGALAMPNAKWPMQNKKKTIPFRQSNRFYRGRIIDILREKPYGCKQLMELLQALYGREEAYYKQLLQRLETEGLVDYFKDFYRLPK